MAFYFAQQRLSPFGEGNATPRWGLRGVTIQNVRAVGQYGEHLHVMFRLSDGKAVRGIWFRHGHAAGTFRVPDTCDVLFMLTQNTFGGDQAAELRILSIKRGHFAGTG
jgi:single-stranded DNA-specific DHH superfamily exonuclease